MSTSPLDPAIHANGLVSRFSCRVNKPLPADLTNSILRLTTVKPPTKETIVCSAARLITGADSGIGRPVALCFAKEGADILFTFLEGESDEQKDADETIRLVEATGRKVVAVPGDICQKSFCQELVKRTVEEFGRLDILVNNATFQRTYKELADIPEGEFDRTYRTNVDGTFSSHKLPFPS
jgi:NADP-dependent 3-hydroxy acid dehydrogenase YdfG